LNQAEEDKKDLPGKLAKGDRGKLCESKKLVKKCPKGRAGGDLRGPTEREGQEETSSASRKSRTTERN